MNPDQIQSMIDRNNRGERFTYSLVQILEEYKQDALRLDFIENTSRGCAKQAKAFREIHFIYKGDQTLRQAIDERRKA